MWRLMCKSKIHRAIVTETNLHYEGSLTLDVALMEAAGLLPFEQVHVLNLNNGERFETYLIEGERGSGVVGVNGAAARLVQVGDPIIVLAYAWGFVAACVGYRLAPQFCYPAALQDCQAAVRWLRANAEAWHIRFDAIGAVGISAGGHLALHLGLRDDDRFEISSKVSKVVAIFAPTDLTAPYYVAAAENCPPLMPNFLRDFLGASYFEAPEVWRDASPIFHVHPDAAPCFLLQGTKDRLVPPDQAIRFVEEMRKVGAKAHLVLIEGLGHGYSLRPTIMRQLHNALEAALQFLASQ